MGKKARREESMKTSNNDKKQLHNLIKVLRPKVYITNSSSFKNLVQELTGNGRSTILSPPTLSISSPTPQNIDVPSYLEPESSRDDASTEFSNHQASITAEEPSPWYYDSSSIYNEITSNYLAMNEEESGCEDLESLLLDIHQYTNYAHIFDDDCDYHFSGLLY